MPDKSTWALCAMMAITGAIIVALTFTAMSKARVLKTSGYGLAAALFVASAIVMALGSPPFHAAKLWAVLLLMAAVWLGFRGVRAYRAKLDLTTIETFEKWADREATPGQENIQIQGAPNDALHKHIKEKLEERPTNPNTVWSLDTLPIELQDVLSDAHQSFGVVKLVGNGKMALTLNNATIWRLEVQSSVPKLSFTGCKIGQIDVVDIASFEIRNCLIGTFTVRTKLRNLEWHSGYLGQFDLVGERAGAFVGDISFHSIMLPHTDEYHGVQSLRDAREALNARNNYVAAGHFHASELKLTRPKKWLRKISSAYWWTSLVYQAGSDFGNSIGRPLACFIVTMLALVALAYEVGTHVARKDDELHGWQITLNDDELLRAAQYAMQSINPLNLFGSPLVVMSQKWGAIAGGILGVIGIAAFALLFLSVRRRFKLE
jgi:hypothetical protein